MPGRGRIIARGCKNIRLSERTCATLKSTTYSRTEGLARREHQRARLLRRRCRTGHRTLGVAPHRVLGRHSPDARRGPETAALRQPRPASTVSLASSIAPARTVDGGKLRHRSWRAGLSSERRRLRTFADSAPCCAAFTSFTAISLIFPLTNPVRRSALSTTDWHPAPVVRPSDPIAPRASSCCPSAGLLNAPSPGSIAVVGWPRTGKTSTATRSASSNSPPSASCSENSVIPHKVSGRTLSVRPGTL